MPTPAPDAERRPTPTPTPRGTGPVATATNLDPPALRDIFGDQVCARVAGDTCTPQPTAADWMKQQNDDMGGGHCFGLAGLSWAMFHGAVNPQRPGSTTAAELQLADNRALQTDIAAVYVTQSTSPTVDTTVALPPSRGVATLAEAWRRGEGFTMAIFNMNDGEPVDGHAVTPSCRSRSNRWKTAARESSCTTTTTRVSRRSWRSTRRPRRGPIPPPRTPGRWRSNTSVARTTRSNCGRWGRCSGRRTVRSARVARAARRPGLRASGRRSGSDFTTVTLNQRANSAEVAFTVADDAGQPIPGAQPVSPLSGPGGTPVGGPGAEGSALHRARRWLRARAGFGGGRVDHRPGYSVGVHTFTIGVGELDTIRFDPATAP